MKTFTDFQAFSKAGRDLAHWHLNYETVACYDGVTIEGSAGTLARKSKNGGEAAKDSEKRTRVSALLSLQPTDCRVTKMKFAKTRDPATNKNLNDKTTVIYNDYVTIRDIPLEAYDYVVNSKPALEWVMERQSVTTDNVQRHHQRRQPLGHRNHGQSQVSPGTVLARHHRQPGNDEDREGVPKLDI